jgi:hypothetical protein
MNFKKRDSRNKEKENDKMAKGNGNVNDEACR